MGEHYSSDEEEVYFGSLAESELTKRRHFLGSNYNSPITPRPPRFNQALSGIQGGLPDVLSSSTPAQRQLSTVVRNDQDTQHNLPSDDSLDDVIILDASANSNSVITLSDDESFLINEDKFANEPTGAEENDESMVKETVSVGRISKVSDSAEISKPPCESLLVVEDSASNATLNGEEIFDKSPVDSEEHGSSLENPTLNNEITNNRAKTAAVEVLHESLSSCNDFVPNLDIVENISLNSSTNTDSVETADRRRFSSSKDYISNPDIAENKSLHESRSKNLENGDNSFTAFETNSLHSSADECIEFESNEETNVLSLVQDIDKFVGDSNELKNSSSTVDQISVTQDHILQNTFETLNLSSIGSSEVKGPETPIFANLLSPKEPSALQKSVNNAEHNTENVTEKHGRPKHSFELSNLSAYEFSLNGVVGDSNELKNSSSTVDQISVTQDHILQNTFETLNLSSIGSSEVKGPETPIFANLLSPKEPSALQKSVNSAEHNTENVTEKHGRPKHSFELSNLSAYEFSLNGVTDSILNISHGSSLPSPPNLHSGNITDSSNLDESIQQQDFHMSVDEIDFQRQEFSDNFVASNSVGNSANISHPSEYKSCLSAYSSFSTACEQTCNSISEQSNSFQNYRVLPCDDLEICSEMEVVSIKSSDENAFDANASFEKVMQNRQNSFNSTPASDISQSNKETKKVMSKLPVYQNTKSLLRPPKFVVKPDNLKTSSCKFAKQISKEGIEKKSSNLSKPEVGKAPGFATINKPVSSPSTKRMKTTEKERTFTKTPTRICTPKQTMPSLKPPSSMTKSKIPSKSCFSVSKTPSQNIVNRTPAKITLDKTPVQNTSGIPRAVKSDSKVNRLLTPLRDHNRKELSAEKSFQSKIKYKNVISPIQAYIRGSPTVLQRKAQMISEEEESPEGQKPTAKHVTPMKSTPRAIQKLDYDNVQGQENVNPNLRDFSRDTIPSKMLEPSVEVFWKEGQQPESHLPKMGEKHIKILVCSPKVKVITHEGRVNQSPKSKGILVPNNENSTSASSEALNVKDFPSVSSDGRISVRIEKAVELP